MSLEERDEPAEVLRFSRGSRASRSSNDLLEPLSPATPKSPSRASWARSARSDSDPRLDDLPAVVSPDHDAHARGLSDEKGSSDIEVPDCRDSYVRVLDTGDPLSPRTGPREVSFYQVVSPALVPVLEPPRDHLEIWMDRRGLGAYSKAVRILGARSVADLSLLDDEDLDAMGMSPREKCDIRVTVEET